jgi:hypothetical protein
MKRHGKGGRKPQYARAAMAPPRAAPPDTGALHLMRVTLEAVTPLAVGSGNSFRAPVRQAGFRPDKETEFEVADVTRDVNGLPTIPGSSIQGVLRNLYGMEFGELAAQAVFGWSKGDDGAVGRLTVGWGAIHGRSGVAVVGRWMPSTAQPDLILTQLREHARGIRDHVSLNARHVVDGRQKFARAFVPKGARFSLEMSLWSDVAHAVIDDRTLLMEIGSLFNHPALSLGGGGGRGYGRVKLIAASHTTPDLTDPNALRTLRSQPPNRSLATSTFTKGELTATFESVVTTARVSLTPVNPWRIGGQGPSITEGTYGARLSTGRPAPCPVDGMELRGDKDIQTIVREPSIVWTGPGNDQAEWKEPSGADPMDVFPAPGSAVRGPLTHRALYHFNLADTSRKIDAATWPTNPELRAERLAALVKRPAPLESLFGSIKEKAATEGGQAARLWVGDGEVTDVKSVQAVDHVSIDRFTGGARDQTGVLYSDEVLVGGEIVLDLTLLPPFTRDKKPTDTGWDEAVVAALLDALADLCQGRLAIGARSLGFCTGTVAWEGANAATWSARWCERSGT